VNESATARARQLADRFWDQLIEIEPLLGTSAGDERFDDRLPDPSETGRARAESVNRAALDDLATIDRSSLDETLRTTLDVLEAIANRYLAALEHRTDRLQVASHLWGPGQLVAEVASVQQADSPERLDRYEARLRAVPAYLEACADVAREGIATGVVSPRVVAERSVAQVERLLSLHADDSPALQPLGDDADARSRIAQVVREAVHPAYEGYLGVLREYLPHATETVGLSSLPDGDGLYATEILSWTGLPLQPRDVHELGVARFDAIQRERRDLVSSLGFASPEEAAAAHQADGANAAPSRDAFLELARGQVERGWDAAPAFFGRMPEANCEVRVVEEFREADMPFAFYQSPTEDGSRPGIYYVNAYDLPSRPLHHLATTTYHEANPGHHFQIAIEQQIPDRPALRRFAGTVAGSAFCEGWGLYSERLADEMGLFVDDWERLGMLDAQAHRAARLITDTGLHALEWTRERAIAKLEEGGVPQVDAVIEVDRYIALPGQALCYMIGMIEIDEARRAARERDGASFSLSDFHDRLLRLGQLPLPALRRELGPAA
jgi:uncharacterized protein (DUF885 family)